VLVLWCWCYVAGAIAAMLGCCAGDVGRLGFLVDQFHTQCSVLFFPLSSGVLTPPCMHLMTMLLASWVAWPASLILGRYFVCESC
jgi:hypothetical protein